MNLADAQAWVNETRAGINSDGIRDFRLSLDGDFVIVSGFTSQRDFFSAVGKTVDEAMAQLRERIPTPRNEAVKLREQAKECLRRAMEIECGGAS